MSSASVLFLGLVFLMSFFSASFASDVTDDYNSLVQCLISNTSTEEDEKSISTIINSPFINNASYVHVLTSLIRNRRFNTPVTPKPSIIITPSKDSHVSAAVICARSLGRELKIRSGGHDYDGLSYTTSTSSAPFFVLDLFNMRSIDVNITNETAWVQSGAMLGELYYSIWKKSNLHAFPAGVCPTVGAGGHLSGGGYGNMMRKYGLSVDHIIDARIVDARGRVLDRESMGEDLFWAIKGGGGGSFGVILGFKIKLVRVPATVTVFRVEKRWDVVADNMTEAVHKWLHVAHKLDNNLFIRLFLQPVSSTVTYGAKTIKASFIAEYLGEVDSLVTIMDRDFPELGATKIDCNEMSWIKSVNYWATIDFNSADRSLLARNLTTSVDSVKIKSDYIKTPISKPGLESLWKRMSDIGKVDMTLNPYGGMMNEIAPSETPMPHRSGNICKIQYSAHWINTSSEEAASNLKGISDLHEFMTQFVSKSPREAYLNYRDVDIGINHHGNNSYEEGMVYGRKYFLDNFDRLVKVKTEVDPDNFFRNEQSIPTLPK